MRKYGSSSGFGRSETTYACVQEVPMSAAVCTRIAEATRGTPYQTEGNGAGKSPCNLTLVTAC